MITKRSARSKSLFRTASPGSVCGPASGFAFTINPRTLVLVDGQPSRSRSAAEPNGGDTGAPASGYELVSVPAIADVPARPIGWSRLALGVILLSLLVGGTAMKSRW
ncbi:hypothetical protein [Sphingomonas sp. DT-204]|uniref:hypothetical protein n=1 Tax=Sphingomonas sp. DT-204 TaxID=3396166 RepID=UPI003F1D2C88